MSSGTKLHFHCPQLQTGSVDWQKNGCHKSVVLGHKKRHSTVIIVQ